MNVPFKIFFEYIFYFIFISNYIIIFMFYSILLYTTGLRSKFLYTLYLVFSSFNKSLYEFALSNSLSKLLSMYLEIPVLSYKTSLVSSFEYNSSSPSFRFIIPISIANFITFIKHLLFCLVQSIFLHYNFALYTQ